MKQNIKIIKIRLSLTGFLFLIIFFPLISQNTQIRELEKKRKEALKTIEMTNKLISESKNTEKSSLNKINLIAAQIKTRKDFIAALNDEMTLIDKEIKEKEGHIQVLDKELKHKQSNYGKTISLMARKNKTEDKLMFILSADNLQQTYRRIRYLREYTLSQSIQGKEIIQKKNTIEEEKQSLLEKKDEKAAVLSERQQEEVKLKEEENVQKQELQKIQTQQKGLQAQLKKQRELADSFNKQIDKLIKEEIERSKAAAKASQKSGNNSQPVRTADSQGGYAMTGEERALANNFGSNRGRLPFPVEGSYVITGSFGMQSNPIYSRVKTNSNGINIQVNSGTDARAVFDGVVSGVFFFAGYNTSVVIRHGKYITVYGNLSEVYVKKGDKVKTRQKLGRIYTDTENDLTQLHFEIWEETNKQNPEIWLGR